MNHKKYYNGNNRIRRIYEKELSLLIAYDVSSMLLKTINTKQETFIIGKYIMI
jgi:hypothetical protein